MTKPFDPTKPVKFKGQPYPVRIVCTDVVGAWPILALLKCGEEEELFFFSRDGKHQYEPNSTWDLINIPEKHVRWVNLYSPYDFYESKEVADSFAGPARRACIRIEWEDGEGL